jgi:hypothetical protein
MPISNNDFYIDNNIDPASGQTVPVLYDNVIGTGDGEYRIMDAFYNDYTFRTYLLLRDDNDISHIYEIRNGSTLVSLYTFDNEAYNEDLAFIHEINNSTYRYWDGDDMDSIPIECITRSAEVISGVGIIGTHVFTNNLYQNDETDNNFIIGRKNILSVASGAVENYFKPAISSNGILTENSSDINVYEFYTEGTNSFSTNYGTYTLSNIVDDSYFDKNYLFSRITASISIFPDRVYYSLKNITLGDFLKEVTVLYDSFFYFDYNNDNNNNMIINVIQRSDTGTATTLGKKTYSEQTFSSFNFGRLNSQVYAQDEQRLRVYIGYYDYKYGTGSIKYKYDLWGINDIDIGNYVEINGNQYLITYIEYLPDSYLTRIECQEIK